MSLERKQVSLQKGTVFYFDHCDRTQAYKMTVLACDDKHHVRWERTDDKRIAGNHTGTIAYDLNQINGYFKEGTWILERVVQPNQLPDELFTI